MVGSANVLIPTVHRSWHSLLSTASASQLVLYKTIRCSKTVGSRPSDHYFRSVCWFVCLSVCLCRVFLSRLWSDLDQTWTYVICLGL